MSADVLKKISKNTGLPENLVTYELDQILKKAGLSKDQVTLEEVREALANYLQDVLLEAKENFGEDFQAAAEA